MEEDDSDRIRRALDEVDEWIDSNSGASVEQIEMRLSDLRETAGATFGRYDVSVEGESPEMVWEDDLGELGDHDEL